MKTYKKLFWTWIQGFVLLPTIALKDTFVARRILEEPQFEKPIGNLSFHIGREAVLGCSIVNLGSHKTIVMGKVSGNVNLEHPGCLCSVISGSELGLGPLSNCSDGTYLSSVSNGTKIQNVECRAANSNKLPTKKYPLQNVVGWLRAEDQTILTMHDRAVLGARYSVTLDSPRTWQLRIRPVRAEDRGCYMCQINTQPSMKWQIGCIDVFVPPDITNEETSADVSVGEMENVTLTCRASGHPPPKITWRREDYEPMLLKKVGGKDFFKVESYVGSSLQLWRVDRKQMGAFLCIASNDVPPAVSKRITLRVNFSPTVIVPNQLLGAPLGTDVVLECTVEAYPSSINYWLKNRGEMLLDGPKYIISEEKFSYTSAMNLTIREFSRNDIGTYNCMSTNSLGKSEGTLRLYEIKLHTGSQASEVSIGGLTEQTGRQKNNNNSSGSTIILSSIALICSIVLCHSF